MRGHTGDIGSNLFLVFLAIAVLIAAWQEPDIRTHLIQMIHFLGEGASAVYN